MGNRENCRRYYRNNTERKRLSNKRWQVKNSERVREMNKIRAANDRAELRTYRALKKLIFEDNFRPKSFKGVRLFIEKYDPDYFEI